MVKIKLAIVPSFAKDEYNLLQAKFYVKMTELVYKALNLDSIRSFIDELVVHFGIKEDIEVRIMRFPSHKSWMSLDERGRVIGGQLYGRAWRNKPLIDIFPGSLFPSKKMKPLYSVGFRGFLLNTIIPALIHELLHISGLKNEDEVRRKTEKYSKKFRGKYLKQLEEELKPIIKEWGKFERENFNFFGEGC